jgi:hypothetical protein
MAVKCIKMLALSLSLLVFPMLAGNSSFLNKPVSLPTGELTLKAVLKSISDQTGCVFSYNPSVVNDQQILVIKPLNNTALSRVLSSILPVSVTYNANGKYILLQKIIPIIIEKPTTSKTKSIIDKDPKKVSLVIPTAVDDYFAKQIPHEKDTMVQILPAEKVMLEPIKPLFKDVEIGIITIDSVAVRKIKIRNFIRRTFELHTGISSSSPLSSVILQAGAFGFYGIASLSTDYNNSYRLGYGVGAGFDFRNNMGININLEQNSLFAGKSYDLGVRAVLTHIDPLVTFAVSRDFRLFIGPSLYMTQSSYESSSTDLGKSYGVGAMIGVKLDLISLLTSTN